MWLGLMLMLRMVATWFPVWRMTVSLYWRLLPVWMMDAIGVVIVLALVLVAAPAWAEHLSSLILTLFGCFA